MQLILHCQRSLESDTVEESPMFSMLNKPLDSDIQPNLNSNNKKPFY